MMAETRLPVLSNFLCFVQHAHCMLDN